MYHWTFDKKLLQGQQFMGETYEHVNNKANRVPTKSRKKKSLPENPASAIQDEKGWITNMGLVWYHCCFFFVFVLMRSMSSTGSAGGWSLFLLFWVGLWFTSTNYWTPSSKIQGLVWHQCPFYLFFKNKYYIKVQEWTVDCLQSFHPRYLFDNNLKITLFFFASLILSEVIVIHHPEGLHNKLTDQSNKREGHLPTNSIT